MILINRQGNIKEDACRCLAINHRIATRYCPSSGVRTQLWGKKRAVLRTKDNHQNLLCSMFRSAWSIPPTVNFLFHPCLRDSIAVLVFGSFYLCSLFLVASFLFPSSDPWLPVNCIARARWLPTAWENQWLSSFSLIELPLSKPT